MPLTRLPVMLRSSGFLNPVATLAATNGTSSFSCNLCNLNLCRCLTEKYDPQNNNHVAIKRAVERGKERKEAKLTKTNFFISQQRRK